MPRLRHYASWRDRFLEQVNGDAGLLLPSAKYEVARAALSDEPRASASGSGPLPHGRGSLSEKYDVARAALPLDEPRASASGSGSGPLPYGRGSLPEIIEVKALPEAA